MPKKFGQKAKILIYSNWLLYIIVMIIGIVKGSIIPKGWVNEEGGWPYSAESAVPYLGILGMYPFILNFFIQLALLLEQKSFREWSGFFRKDYPSDTPSIYLRQRRINAGFFLFFYVYLWSYGIGICFAMDIAFYIFVLGFFAPAGLLMLLWFVCGNLIGLRVAKNRAAKKLLIEDIRRGLTNIPTLAQKHLLSLEKTRYFIHDAINENLLTGKISEDGLKFITLEWDASGRIIEQKPAKVVAEELQETRSENLRKILKRYGNQISLSKMAQLLEFKDIIDLEKWLLSLPEDIALQIEGDQVLLPQELQSGTKEAEQAIDKLLARFEEYERQAQGKV